MKAARSLREGIVIKDVYWHTPGRILIAEYTGYVTPEDLDQSFVRIRAMVRQDGLPPYVHLIGDSSARTGFDPALFRLGTLTRITNVKEDKSQYGWVIAVDDEPNPILHFGISAVTQLTRSRYRMFRTQAEALAFLYEIDSTLVDPQAQVPHPSDEPDAAV
jgi:hypothetical protein